MESLSSEETAISGKKDIGFLDRYHALHALAQKDRSADWIIFLLQTLMVLIEVSPLVAKLLSPRGAYEKCFSLEELRIVDEYGNIDRQD